MVKSREMDGVFGHQVRFHNIIAQLSNFKALQMLNACICILRQPPSKLGTLTPEMKDFGGVCSAFVCFNVVDRMHSDTDRITLFAHDILYLIPLIELSFHGHHMGDKIMA